MMSTVNPVCLDMYLFVNYNQYGRRNSGEAISGKDVSCSVEVLRHLGGSGGMPPPENFQDFKHSHIKSGAI